MLHCISLVRDLSKSSKMRLWGASSSCYWHIQAQCDFFFSFGDKQTGSCLVMKMPFRPLVMESLVYVIKYFLFFFLFFFLNFYLLINLFLAVLGLRFCARAFSSCGKWGGHSSSRCTGLSLSRLLLLRSTGSRCAGSVVVAYRPSRSVACGIFPDQGLNPCPLHWQAGSQPLRHQGSPVIKFFKSCFRICAG